MSIFLYLDVCKRIFLDTVTNAKKGSAVQQNCQNGIALKNLVFCKNCVWVFLVLSFHSKKRADALWNGTSFKISSNYISDVKQYLIIFSYWCISFSTWILMFQMKRTNTLQKWNCSQCLYNWFLSAGCSSKWNRSQNACITDVCQ